MKYILVTGASGFLGSRLCEVLLARGHRVLGIGRKDAFNTSLKASEKGFLSPQTLAHQNFKYEQLELKNLNKDSLKNYELSLVFHLASMVEYASHNYHNYHNYTITPTLNLIDFALHRAIPKIVFTSTASVFAQPERDSTHTPYLTSESSPISPLSNYALAKYTCEKLLELATIKTPSLKVATLRFPALFGIRHLGGVVYEFAHRAWHHQDIELFGNGTYLRNILYVDHAIEALILASEAQSLKPYEMFVLGSKSSQSTAFIAQNLIDLLGSNSRLILSDKPSPNPFNSELDTQKAQALLGFQAPSIEEGLQAYATDIRTQGGFE